jgi:hypothetical protein
MNRIFHLIGVGALLGTMGCANIGSAMGGNTAMTGEAWYAKITSLGALVISSQVYYCPAPQSGPAQCKEAKMVEGDKK